MYACRRAIGMNWGISPKSAKWIFDMVIKPILMYGALVWWKALEKSTYCNHTEGIMRASALMITGATRSTPSQALFTLMHWLPADLMARQLALNSAVRLHAAGIWKPNRYGHASILGCTSYIPENIDYCSPTTLPDKKFTVKMSNEPSFSEGETLDIFTDGSKSTKGVGGGFFIPRLNKAVCFRLNDYCSVIQAEISAIKRAVNWMRYYRICNGNIRICTDSKPAIKSLSGVYTTSRLVRECRVSLDEMANHSCLELLWVPGHSNIPGNRKADELAKAGSRLNTWDTDTLVGIPLSCCKAFIQHELYGSAQTRWSSLTYCSISRMTWPLYDERRSFCLMGLSRMRLRILVSILTGHCTIGAHARRLNLPYNDFCRSCQSEDEEETVEHFLCLCPALANIRTEFLGSPILHELAALSNIDVYKIESFIRASGWFNTISNTDM